MSACGMRTYSACVPSIALPRIQPPVVQCEYMPLRQYSHLPQDEMQEISTWSPGLKVVTPAPTSSTTPTPSWPRMRPGVAGRHVALEDVQVGAADRGLGDLDDGVGRRLQLRHRPVLDGLASGPAVDECFHDAAPRVGSEPVRCYGRAEEQLVSDTDGRRRSTGPRLRPG